MWGEPAVLLVMATYHIRSERCLRLYQYRRGSSAPMVLFLIHANVVVAMCTYKKTNNRVSMNGYCQNSYKSTRRAT